MNRVPFLPAFDLVLSEDGREAGLVRTADDTAAGITDLNRQTPAMLRAAADAMDRAQGRLPGT